MNEKKSNHEKEVILPSDQKAKKAVNRRRSATAQRNAPAAQAEEKKALYGMIEPPAKKRAKAAAPQGQPSVSKSRAKKALQGTSLPEDSHPTTESTTRQKRALKPSVQRQEKRSEKQVSASASNKTLQQNAPAQGRAMKTSSASRSKGQKSKAVKKPSVIVYFLGGLNEIGKNMTVFECEGDMIIVDCGMTFPTEDMLGIDLVIPDFTFVEQHANQIRGIFLTHGHEDHIGSLPYLLKRVKFPIYGTALTLGLVSGKLKEHGLSNRVELHQTSPGQEVSAGCFQVEFIHVNHSISDAVGFAIHTPAGTIVHTGDFKIDCTPEKGEMIDLGRFALLGRRGVLALFADSTNAERPGYTQTEQTVKASFENLFRRAEKNRIIIATFASNISRVQQIINCAKQYGRRVAFSGRSMVNVMGIAAELGKLEIPEGVLIDIDMINRYPKEQIVIVTTGSQGEPMSALTRMAFADHRKVSVGPGDVIIISARPIPGNEKTVGSVVDELLKRGCEVVYESMYEVHVSGHACQEELKLMQGVVHPKYFIPVHGEQKHLRKHAMLAERMGMDTKNIFIGNIGDAIEINEDYLKPLPPVQAGRVMVDGLGVGDVGSVVLRDRKHLGEDGLIVVVCTLDSENAEMVSGPDVVSRGFVYVRESEPLMDEVKNLVYNILEKNLNAGICDHTTLKVSIKDGVSRMLYERTRRSPMILPVIMDV